MGFGGMTAISDDIPANRSWDCRCRLDPLYEAVLPGTFQIIETDTMDAALHRIVMGQHHSLLVTRDREIIGILRSADVFNGLCKMIDGCAL